jgi:hypothetical protein
MGDFLRIAPIADLAALPPLVDGWESLRQASLRFLSSPWCDVARAAGWDQLEVWACFPSMSLDIVRRRTDCLGLVPALSLGVGCTIERIDERQAVVTRRRTGARLVHRRELTGVAWSTPWWRAIQTAQENEQ